MTTPDVKTLEERFNAVASALRAAIDDGARQVQALRVEAQDLPVDPQCNRLAYRLDWAEADIQLIREEAKSLGEWFK